MYCSDCGAKLVPQRQATGRYSPSTGQPTYFEWLACPTYLAMPWWRRALSIACHNGRRVDNGEVCRSDGGLLVQGDIGY